MAEENDGPPPDGRANELQTILGPVPARAWSTITIRPAADSSSPEAAQRGAASLRFALIALAAFVLAVIGVSWVATWPGKMDAPLRAKYRHFLEHKDDFDLVCFGSSNLHRSIMPALLDAELAELGVTIRSFNLAIPGMRAAEADYTLRQVLAKRPARMRFALIELSSWNPQLPNANTVRSVSWHTTRQTLNAWRSARALEPQPRDPLTEFAPHVRAWTLNIGNVGCGPEVVGGWLGLTTPRDGARSEFLLDAIDERRGFIALDDAPKEVRERRHRPFLADPSKYLAEVEAMGEPEQKPGRALRQENVEALRAQVALLREHGIEPIYIVGPIPRSTPHVEQLVADGVIPAVITLNDPDRYPELFDLKNRFDAEHVDANGARLLTKELARQLAPHLRGGE